MAGLVKDNLAPDVPFAFESNRWYKVQIVCKDNLIQCFVNDKLVQQASMRPIPSLVVVTTRDEKNKQFIIKVVNTTRHPEKTQLNVNGGSFGSEAEVTELSGEPESENFFSTPNKVSPVKKKVGFAIGGPVVYEFPPSSLTILRIKFD
jgi:alpha-L-arabinofuranosidase